MKSPLIFLSLAVLLFGCSKASEPSRSAETEAKVSEQAGSYLQPVLSQAKAEKKLVFLEFTGSDWCPPCQELEARFLPAPRFVDFASKHLVMTRLDFPKKEKLPPDEERRNEALGEKFQIQGFPTIIILDPDGKELWRTTGLPPSVGSLLAELEQLVDKAPASK